MAELFEGDEGKTGWRDDSWWSAEWWRTGPTDHKKQTREEGKTLVVRSICPSSCCCHCDGDDEGDDDEGAGPDEDEDVRVGFQVYF